MSADPNKKSVRQFQCRDVLWETFEQMARELECSVDYLVNEAMKQYARQRNYGSAGGGAPQQGRQQGQYGSQAPPPYGSAPPPAMSRGGGPLPAPPSRGGVG